MRPREIPSTGGVDDDDTARSHALSAAPDHAPGPLAPLWCSVVAGSEVPARTLQAVLDPDDGATVAEVGVVGPEQADVALAAAARAAAGRESWPADRRADSLLIASRLVIDRRPEFAGLITAEGIKTLSEAEAEVDRAAHTLALSAAAVRRAGPCAPAADDRSATRGWRAELRREPVGVVVAITPFNDPLNLVAHKVAPALAAGNAAVVKPDPRTPLSALLLARVLLEAGVPPDRLSVLVGGGELVNQLVSDRRVRFVSFTGGRTIGALVNAAAGTKRTLLELGGVCPTVVWEDADLGAAVPDLIAGAFSAAGQNCLHVQRILVHRSRYDELRERLVAAARCVRVGRKDDPDTDMGPLIDDDARRRVGALVSHARLEGATIATGGSDTTAGYAPTLVTDVTDRTELTQKEVFGPVTSIEPFEDLAHCLRMANSGGGALQAGVLTLREDVIEALVAGLDAGGVVIGGTSDHRSDALPFGGTGQAGIGREGVNAAADAMSELKTVLRLPVLTRTSK